MNERDKSLVELAREAELIRSKVRTLTQANQRVERELERLASDIRTAFGIRSPNFVENLGGRAE